MHTYFISNGTHVKIGKSFDPQRSLLQLQIGFSTPLWLLMTIRGDYEEAYRQMLQPSRRSGEWFVWEKSTTQLVYFVVTGRSLRPEDTLFDLVPKD